MSERGHGRHATALWTAQGAARETASAPPSKLDIVHHYLQSNSAQRDGIAPPRDRSAKAHRRLAAGASGARSDDSRAEGCRIYSILRNSFYAGTATGLVKKILSKLARVDMGTRGAR